MPTQEWIKAALKEKGYKLKDVAKALMLPAPRITDILKGERGVQSSEVVPLADMLGLSPRSLLTSLKQGKLVVVPGSDENSRLQVLGLLTGDGTVLPVPDNLPYTSIAVPPDAESTEGLYCYVMGDSSMAKEIAHGSLIIAADPKRHFYPMVPGALFLMDIGEGALALRRYVKTRSGEDWLVPLPEEPNPAFKSWRFSLLPADLAPALHHKDMEIADQKILRTDDIVAAVLWVHRRHMPKSPVEPA